MNNKEENLLFKVNDYDLFKRLVEQGLDVKKINKKGETILHHTASEKIVELIDDAIDVDHQDEDGRTALFWCFSNPNKLKALLKHKADVNITDKTGNTALHQYVEGYGVKNIKSEEVVKLLLNTDIKVNHKNNDGKTALDRAKYDKIKKLLLEKEAKPSS